VLGLEERSSGRVSVRTLTRLYPGVLAVGPKYLERAGDSAFVQRFVPADAYLKNGTVILFKSLVEAAVVGGRLESGCT
jgi:hypothetical protein